MRALTAVAPVLLAASSVASSSSLALSPCRFLCASAAARRFPLHSRMGAACTRRPGADSPILPALPTMPNAVLGSKRTISPSTDQQTCSFSSDTFARVPYQPSESKSDMAGDGKFVKYEVEERGSLYSLDYRLFIKGPQGYVSPWHDIPLFADEAKKIYNMVVEIPRWSNAKMEMATKEPLSPIKQDEKKGLPRFVHNIFPHHGYIWNYGALPQTWENNDHTDPDTGAKGDNDPIDVVEIGSAIHGRGAVIQVKIVGCLALIDDGETDWKLVAIDVTDPVAANINNMDDVEKVFPGLPRATYEWFRTYKIPAGKPANQFAFGGQFKDAAFCEKTIADTHAFWKELIADPNAKLNTLSRVPGAVNAATAENSAALVAAAPAPAPESALPADLDKWHFITDSKL